MPNILEAWPDTLEGTVLGEGIRRFLSSPDFPLKVDKAFSILKGQPVLDFDAIEAWCESNGMKPDESVSDFLTRKFPLCVTKLKILISP